jgi:hypothetical protein
VQSGVVPVDLRQDLGITGFHPHFSERVTVKPAARHRITVEGTPYRLEGDNVIEREFVFAGSVYRLRDRVRSQAEINLVTAGYEFEIVSGERGHLSLGGGAGYVEATGTLRSEASGFTGVEEQSFPLPVLQMSARYWPAARVHVGGEAKGMSLGGYGYFAQATVEGGVAITRWLGAMGGYRYVEADVHRLSGTRGIALRFSGPVVSLRITR